MSGPTKRQIDNKEASCSKPENIVKDFPDGSILKMTFHNFLTYQNAVCFAGENLNLILGHNGSGKSSIICGICLVFGGHPKLIGRSEKMADYIKHGCQEGFVEVLLADKVRGAQTLRITISHSHPTSYHLNGKSSSQKEMKGLCARYNIQIDNPCAFLAQDKVKSFSEQSPIELLLNTEKAASAQLLEEHTQLNEQRTDVGEYEKKCQLTEKAIQQLTDESAVLEQRVAAYLKRKNAVRRLNLLEQKKILMEFAEEEEKLNKLLVAVDKEMDRVKKSEEAIERKKAMIAFWKNKSSLFQTQLKDMSSRKNLILKSIEDGVDKNFVRNEINAAKAKLEEQTKLHLNYESNEKDLTMKVKNFKERMDQAKESLHGYSEYKAAAKVKEAKITALNSELKREQEEIASMERTRQNINFQIADQRKKTNTTMDSRLRQLDQLFPNVYRAYIWYRNHEDQFRGKVFCPLIHVTIKKGARNNLIENVVGRRDLCMLICTHKEDEKLLYQAVGGRGINTTVVRPESIKMDEINGQLPAEMVHLGFEGFVSNSFDAPPEVKSYMCKVSSIHLVPYGNVDRNTDNIVEYLSKTRSKIFLTNTSRISLSRSKYSGLMAQQRDIINPGRCFRDQCFVDSLDSADEVKKLKESLKTLEEKCGNARETIEEKLSRLSAEKEGFDEENREWKKKNDLYVGVQNLYETESARLKRLREDRLNLEQNKEAAEREFVIAKKLIVETALKKIAELKGKMQTVVELSKSHMFLACRDFKANRTLTKLEDEKIEMEEQLLEEKRRFDAAEDYVRCHLASMNSIRNQLQNKCGLKNVDEDKCDDDEKKILKALRKAFDEFNLPDEEKEIYEQIAIENTKLGVVDGSSTDRGVEDESRLVTVKKSLEEKKLEHERNVATRANLDGNLSKSIEKWRGTIDEMIQKINENYTVYFKKLGCTGEVHLDVPENKLDINKYGIMIMVSFRAGEKMKRLDHNVQSGGERSVSTMLYLLALQHLCPVPFRCVDEINQGMDPTNEKKVFEIMVDSWSEDSQLAKTQYFLLTPKLLHDLKMNKRVTVQIVHTVVPNTVKEWEAANHIEKMKQKLIAA